MVSFDEREKGFESKFVYDQELKFKVMARRNKLLGLWAADLMGLSQEAAKDYAKTVVKADLEEPGDEDVFRKVRADFDDKKIAQSDHQLRRTMEELIEEAYRQIESDKTS